MNILELKLQAVELDGLKEFYSAKLGFEITTESDNALTFNIGSSKLTFELNKNAANYYYHYAFNIPENQLNEAIQWVQKHATLLEHEGSPVIDFPNWNAHSVYFYDPEGNIIELIARHNLDNRSTEKFSSKSIINISEAGMPVSSVKALHEKLKESFGADLWWGNLETFAAIGDENDLFIAVTTHRNWFPTHKPSASFPFSVSIEGSDKKTIVFEDYIISSHN